MRLIGIVAGRFQPFHSGHFQIYKELCRFLQSEEVYLVTSNKQDLLTDPLSLEEKQYLVETCFKIPKTKLFETQSPYRPFDILHRLGRDQDVAFVFGVSGAKTIELVSKIYPVLPTDMSKIKPYRDGGQPYYKEIETAGADLDSEQIRIVSPNNSDEENILRMERFFTSRDPSILKLLLKRFGPPQNPISGTRDLEDPAYKAWRMAVFSRDGFTCQLSGQKGGNLQAHHIERWADNPSKRYDVSNGITLSETAHAQVTGHEDSFAPQFKKIVEDKMRLLRIRDGKKVRSASSILMGNHSGSGGQVFYFPKDPRSRS